MKDVVDGAHFYPKVLASAAVTMGTRDQFTGGPVTSDSRQNRCAKGMIHISRLLKVLPAKKLRSAGETDPASLSSTRQLRAFGDLLDRELQGPPPKVFPSGGFENHKIDMRENR